jgi:hypothetical protein
MNRNLRFSPYVASMDYVSKEAEQRGRALRYSALLAGALAAGAFELVVLVRMAATPPQIVGYAGGYLYSTPPVPASFELRDLYPQYRDTIEETFHRTEKGSLPALADFLGPGVKDFVDRQYTRVQKEFPEGYSQTFTVLDERFLGFSPTEGMRVDYRGTWGIRSTAGMATSVIYLRARFGKGVATKLNSSGWRLVGLDVITEDDFYAAERAAEREQRLGLGTGASKR